MANASPDHDATDDGDDARAFEREFTAAAPALLTWARLRIRPELRTLLEPEDLVQEVGCRAFAAFAAFDPERASFRQWLFGFANRVLLEALRQLGRSTGLTPATAKLGVTNLAATVTTITARIARDERVRAFLARVDELDDPDRALLLRRGLEGQGYGDVAASLGVAEDAVRKRWQRLCERMRDDPVFAALAAA